MAIILPSHVEINHDNDPTVASRWADWIEGLEAMMRTMIVTEEKRKKSLLLYYMDMDTTNCSTKYPTQVQKMNTNLQKES